MDRRAVLRRPAAERRQPELIRASYSPAATSRPVSNFAVERPSREHASQSMSGTTHFQSVDPEPDTSRSAGVDQDRSAPASASETPTSENWATASDSSASEYEADVRQPAAILPTVRRNAAPRPAISVSADDADASDVAAPAAHNAVHPSFARHAAVRTPIAATILDDRATTAMEPTGEYSNEFNI